MASWFLASKLSHFLNDQRSHVGSSLFTVMIHHRMNFLASTNSIRGFPCGSAGQESTCNVGDFREMGLIPGWERSHMATHSTPGEPDEQRNLAGYSPEGHKESDMTIAS